MSEIVSKNPVTEATEKHVASRSHFSLGAPRLNTYRFGEYGCMDAVEIVPDDKNFRVMLRHKLLTYTLGQPLLSRAMMKKDLFYVPAPCILPLNWDKVYTNPLHGDDVNAGDVGCSVSGFTHYISAAFEYVGLNIDAFIDLDEPPTDAEVLELEIKYALGLEMFFSSGSLLHQLGVKMQDLVSFTDMKSFDKNFDAWFSGLSTYVKSFIVSGLTPEAKTVIVDGEVKPGNLSLRQFLCLARDGFSWQITSVTKQSGMSIPTGLRPSFSSELGTTVVNLARPVAYQICCAHYYSNDKIDYIYDANLYRQNVYDCLLTIDRSNIGDVHFINDTFNLNGSYFRYDSCSAYFFKQVCGILMDGGSETVFGDLPLCLDYFRLLFGFNRSLRYMDYFTNAKSQPLAVGDVNIAVSSNKVNAIDVSKGIQRARFLNAVNRFGRRMSEYVKGLFPGVHLSPDFHDPFFLAHTTDVIGQQQVESTGENQFAQNSISTILRSDSGQYGMETDFEKPGIFIGIVYFDIERAYSMGIDRAVQHLDRYDMFNPFMQFTGDQDIHKDELMSSGNGTFGYTLRYMEYKTRTPQVSGGFVENLPGYAFLAEEERNFGEKGYGDVTISPSFIRSLQTELDKFYTSLTGYSLGSYFHFIVVNDNTIEVDRPMAYAPSIL